MPDSDINGPESDPENSGESVHNLLRDQSRAERTINRARHQTPNEGIPGMERFTACTYELGIIAGALLMFAGVGTLLVWLA